VNKFTLLFLKKEKLEKISMIEAIDPLPGYKGKTRDILTRENIQVWSEIIVTKHNGAHFQGILLPRSAFTAQNFVTLRVLDTGYKHRIQYWHRNYGKNFISTTWVFERQLSTTRHQCKTKGNPSRRSLTRYWWYCSIAFRLSYWCSSPSIYS
jgi:hypothetical protein